MFDFFPNTDFNKINLDWIMRKLKEQISGLVASVNGMTGDVTLTAEDVGALPEIYTPPVESVNGRTGDVEITADDVGASILTNGIDRVVNIPSSVDIEYFSAQLVNLTPNDIYALYDALEVFTRDSYGMDDAGNPLVYYRYTAPVLQNSTNLPSYVLYNTGYPHLVLVSGVHGDEKGSVAATYLFIKELFTHPESYGSILNNISMTIIPVANPYGFTNNLRRNPNNVDINRNFPYGWSESSSAYKGNAPLDQKESQFLAHLVDTARGTYGNGVFVMDMHQFHTNENTEQMFWYNCASTGNYPTIRNDLLKTVGYLRETITRDYPEIAPLPTDTDYMAFYAVGDDATFISYAVKKGCCGFLCESPQAIRGGTIYSVDSLNIAYRIHANSAWSTLSRFFPYPQEAIRNLSDIGMTTDNTITELLSAIPYRAVVDVAVADDTPLHDSITTLFGAFQLHISALAGVGVDGLRTLEVRSTDANGYDVVLFNTAINNVIVNKWGMPVTPSIQRTHVTTLFNDVKTWGDAFPLQIRYTSSGGEMSVPYEGLLVVFHIPTSGVYDHTWCLNINASCTHLCFTHFRPTTQLPLTWTEVSLA